MHHGRTRRNVEGAADPGKGARIKRISGSIEPKATMLAMTKAIAAPI
jgi:hypothetical protein